MQNISSINKGQELFTANCVVCQRVNAIGLVENWKVKVDGKYSKRFSYVEK